MGLNKRCVFYTISAIALILVIFITYGSYNKYTLTEKMNNIESRIDTVNFFIKDVEKDLEKGAFIAGFRTILSFNEYIITNGTYLNDIDERFKEAFLNGTIYGQSLTLMADATFTDWAKKISTQSNRIDIIFNFTLNDVDLIQIDPFTIDIKVNMTLYVRDKSNLSAWRRERQITSRIDIAGFEDPLYVVNSQGKVTNLIDKTNITQFIINKNPSNLLIHNNRTWYIARNGSPSFLMRFEGDLSNSSFGIESLVNIDEFESQGMPAKDRSLVDYIYFGNQTTTNNRINLTPSWFKIDNEHLDIYDVENITCTLDCITP